MLSRKLTLTLKGDRESRVTLYAVKLLNQESDQKLTGTRFYRPQNLVLAGQFKGVRSSYAGPSAREKCSETLEFTETSPPTCDRRRRSKLRQQRHHSADEIHRRVVAQRSRRIGWSSRLATLTLICGRKTTACEPMSQSRRNGPIRLKL